MNIKIINMDQERRTYLREWGTRLLHRYFDFTNRQLYDYLSNQREDNTNETLKIVAETLEQIEKDPSIGFILLFSSPHNVSSLHNHPIRYFSKKTNRSCPLCNTEEEMNYICVLDGCDFHCCVSCYSLDVVHIANTITELQLKRIQKTKNIQDDLLLQYSKKKSLELETLLLEKYNIDAKKVLDDIAKGYDEDPICLGASYWTTIKRNNIKYSFDSNKKINIKQHPHTLVFNNGLMGFHQCDVCHNSIIREAYRCQDGCDFDCCLNCIGV